MNLNALPPTVTPATTSIPLLTAGTTPGQLPFAEMIGEFIQNVDVQQQTVSADIDRLARGESDNLQAIAANVAKADLSFRFLIEMREKIIASYQEVMRMQV